MHAESRYYKYMRDTEKAVRNIVEENDQRLHFCFSHIN